MSELQRKEVPIENTWDTSVIFATDVQWEDAYQTIQVQLNEFEPFRDQLTTAQNIYRCLQRQDELSHVCEKIYVYANLKYHEDTTDTTYQSFADRAEMLLTKFSAATSFIESQLLQNSKEKMVQFLKEYEPLQLYTHFIDNLFRMKDHILPEALEELLAEASEIGSGPDQIYSTFTDADLTFGVIQDENGNDVQLTHGRFISFMESKNRDVRKAAFETFYRSYIQYKNTFASLMNANVKKDLFFSKARKFPSSLAQALSGNNIPVAVYENLIATVHEFLPVMHQYVAIRKKRLGLSEIHMYDLYTPIVLEANTAVTYEEAKTSFLKSIQPLGQDYVKTATEAFDGRWIDVYENKGKRSGAYSWGIHGAHPFVLLNFDAKVNDMFTLAHEMGHAMHSHYSWGTQPYCYSGYPIFLAEVASTVNEALLMEYLLKTTKDNVFRDYLLNYFVEQFRTTLFRQTMFAEFEMKIHKMIQEGQPLTVDVLCGVYRELNRQYYGNDIVLDEEIDMEWSRIPHFYSSFYVYQYATGYSAAIALSKKILNEGDKAVGNYLDFLKGGSSDYAIELLKKAGVDMSSPKPVHDALTVFQELVNAFEK